MSPRTARGKWVTASEYRRRQMLEEIDEEVRVPRGDAPLERPPQNGEYRGPLKVRVLPPGLALRPVEPGQLGVSKGAFVRNRRR